MDVRQFRESACASRCAVSMVSKSFAVKRLSPNRAWASTSEWPRIFRSYVFYSSPPPPTEAICTAIRELMSLRGRSKSVRGARKSWFRCDRSGVLLGRTIRQLGLRGVHRKIWVCAGVLKRRSLRMSSKSSWMRSTRKRSRR